VGSCEEEELPEELLPGFSEEPLADLDDLLTDFSGGAEARSIKEEEEEQLLDLLVDGAATTG